MEETCKSAKKTRRSSNKEIKIPRPPNAFMIYGQEHRQFIAAQFPCECNREISKRLGQAWRQLPISIKDTYYVRAKFAESEHKKKYPNYSYNPMEARKRKQLEMQEKMGLAEGSESLEAVAEMQPPPAKCRTPAGSKAFPSYGQEYPSSSSSNSGTPRDNRSPQQGFFTNPAHSIPQRNVIIHPIQVVYSGENQFYYIPSLNQNGLFLDQNQLYGASVFPPFTNPILPGIPRPSCTNMEEFVSEEVNGDHSQIISGKLSNPPSGNAEETKETYKTVLGEAFDALLAD